MKLTSTHYIIGVILILVIIAYMTKDTIKKAFTRGYTNKNPGNIIKDGQTWVGEVPSTDKTFKQFKSMPYGYRAMWVNLRSYLNSGVDTISKIISRYAPPSENDTKAYIAAVSKSMGKSPDTKLTFTDTPAIRSLIMAISEHENGLPANRDDVDAGFKLLNS